VARIRNKYSRQQRLRVRVRRFLEDRLYSPMLDDVSQIHHGDPVCNSLYHVQIVGYKEVRDARFVLNFTEELD